MNSGRAGCWTASATLVVIGFGIRAPLAAQENDSRVQMNVTAGIILAKERDDFSETDAYLALDTEILAREPALFSPDGSSTHFVAPSLNIRLTSIPVDPAVENQAPIPTSEFDGFLKSQKAAVLQLGTFVGFVPGSTQYEVGDRTRAIAFGPLVRASFQSVTDRQKTLRVWKPDDDLYEAWTVGGRVAWLEQTDGRTQTLGYVDASVGRFQNFETAIPITDAGRAFRDEPTPANAALVGPDDFDVTKGNRMFLEGRMRLPGAQFVYIGVDLNSGRGRDDMRFLGGVTFDLGAALTGLTSQ